MRTIAEVIDPVAEQLAYKVGYNIGRDYLWMSERTGGPIDRDRLRAELDELQPVNRQATWEGADDAISGRPCREW